jgi:hypothetical protein
MPLMRIVVRCVLFAFPFAWLQALAFVSGAANDFVTIALRLIAILLLMGLVSATRWLAVRGWSLWWTALLAACAAFAYVAAPRSAWAWVALGTWLSFVAWLDIGVQVRTARRIARWGARFVLGALAGFVPVIVAQVLSAFADEEFYALAQAFGLAVFCVGLLFAAADPDHRRRPVMQADRTILRWAIVFAVVISVTGTVGVVKAYESSFYTTDPPSFPGITAAHPAACTAVEQQPDRVSGVETFDRLLRAVEANPDKTPAEFGMLALARNDRVQAELFRRALLAEAQVQRFTQPMGSVKFGQFEAALRVYYFSKVKKQFSDLVNAADERVVRNWFAAINRRALTAEWVDWSYAVAFSKWPDGPYENQEIGAGLLAILEASGLGDPALSTRNRAYLDANPRGWAARFHNTDDAYFYHGLWLNNALFQSLYAPSQVSETYQRQSFEWLLQQAVPDGSPLAYNVVGRPWAIGAYYLGAVILSDPHYLWLAARSLDRLEASGGFLSAQPGIESPVDMTGIAPTTGSCLQYGDSGLPNQIGPLAPDKIILRDGWDSAASYLLLNLRFTGWHRYKATNDIISLYSGGPLVTEQVVPTKIGWLPQGRDALRDKRVPRENLNGLLIPVNGLGGVFAALGIGDRWAQDPPWYVRITEFATDTVPQTIKTSMLWGGWAHTRAIYFYPQGPTIIVDSAEGGEGHAALSWHTVGAGQRAADGIWLRQGQNPARLVFISDTGSEAAVQPEQNSYGAGQSIVYYAPQGGRLHAISVFLSGRWASATVTMSPQFRTLRIQSETETIELPIQSE